MMSLIYRLLKPTFIEAEFALALIIAGFLVLMAKKLKRKKNNTGTEDDETHWI